MTPVPREDTGFTLIEMVIAMLIMATAVVTIVGALSAMITLTGSHRGHALTELAARSYGEAAQQQAHFATQLTTAVDASETTLAVKDTSLLEHVDTVTPAATYIVIDREVMRVTAISGTQLTVVRGVNGVDTLAVHAVNAVVLPVLRCPTLTQLTPASETFEHATGVSAALSGIEYWDAVGNSFTADRNACLNGIDLAGGVHSPGYDETCSLVGAVASPECGWTYYRATVTLTTPGDSRLRAVTTSTRIFIRGGSN